MGSVSFSLHWPETCHQSYARVECWSAIHNLHPGDVMGCVLDPWLLRALPCTSCKSTRSTYGAGWRDGRGVA